MPNLETMSQLINAINNNEKIEMRNDVFFYNDDDVSVIADKTDDSFFNEFDDNKLTAVKLIIEGNNDISESTKQRIGSLINQQSDIISERKSYKATVEQKLMYSFAVTAVAAGVCTGLYYAFTAVMAAKAAPGFMVIVAGVSLIGALSSYNSLCDKAAMRNQQEFKKINTGNKNSAEPSSKFTQAQGNIATINNSSQSTPLPENKKTM
jgi:lipopolysaccharide export LptBFGC system permease protein LptF